MRLFAAIAVPHDVASELCRWARHAIPGGDGVRKLEPDALHLTLCFLGEHDPVDVPVAAGILERCARPLGELLVGAPVWLPPRRPRALAIELHEEHDALAALQADVAAGMTEELDWQPERRRYRPHVTVVRLAARAQVPSVGLPPTPPLRFTAGELVLFASRLLSSGAEYDALVRLPL